MSSATPLTIGLPVYNGENFLAQSLDDLLAQHYGDFRLVISDNASEDRTEAICREYAARDTRIRFIRHEKNRGGVWNYNFTFHQNQSRFFKWANHDDGHAPTYLSRCMETMASAPLPVALVYPQVALIGPDGSHIRDYDERLDLRHPDPAVRLGELVRNIRMVNSLLGVIRAEVLASTRLNQCIPAYDNLLLAELALRGEFWEIPERLFFRRVHPAAASRAKGFAAKLSWASADATAHERYPILRRVAAHMDAIERAPLSRRQKIRAHLHYLPAHAHARLRHRRHRVASTLRRGVRSIGRGVVRRRTA